MDPITGTAVTDYKLYLRLDSTSVPYFVTKVSRWIVIITEVLFHNLTISIPCEMPYHFSDFEVINNLP